MGKKERTRVPRELFRSWLRKIPTRFSTRQEELKRETIAGSDVVVIENVLKHLDIKDLMNCRLVNSNWSQIATSRLVKLNVGCKGFQYHYIRKCYVSAGSRQLSDLVKCAENSVRFPCTSFAFRAGDMCSDDAKKFLTVMGSTVTELLLISVDNSSLCGKMNLSHILQHTPNLETLIFDGASYFDISITVPLMLSSLETIKIVCQFYVSMLNFEYVLSAAPNLKNIIGAWRLDELKSIVTMNKVCTVKSWCPVKFPFHAGFIQLATTTETGELKLNELVLSVREAHSHANGSDDVCLETLWKCLIQVLDKNSIRKLILNCSAYTDKMSLPLNMSSVTELILMPFSHPQTLRHFPIGTDLSLTFPRLNTLSFFDPSYRVCCVGSKWEDCFPLSETVEDFSGILGTVTTLNLRGESASIRMLRRMKKICPNVQNLEVCFNKQTNNEEIIKEVCGDWRNLKKLSIDMEDVDLELLDPVFTGLSQKCLVSLNDDGSLTEQAKLKKVEDLRYVLWIGNIAGLIKLDIKYVAQTSIKSNNQILTPFTKLSGLYAFKLMPKLTVNLFYSMYGTESNELQTAFQSISQFTTISRYSRF